MSTPTENEIFGQLKSIVLNENRSFLCDNIEPKLHFPYLRSKLVLCKEDEEEIGQQTTTKLKVHKLIDILMQRHEGYDHLVKSIIQEKVQIFIAEKLNKDFEEKKKRLMAPVSIERPSNGCSFISSLPSRPQSESLPNRTSTDISYSVDSTSMEDIDSLPKPVLNNKSKSIAEDKYPSHNQSCENSFYEGSIDEKLSLHSGSLD